MMNPKLKEFIRRNCPDVEFLKNIMKAKKKSRIMAHQMDEADIQAGETSFEQKKEVVEIYKGKWPRYTQQLTDFYNTYVTHITNPEIVVDGDRLIKVLFDCFAYGFLPDEHFFFNLDGRSRSEKESFASDRDCEMAVTLLNDIKEIGKYFDKSSGYKKYAKYYKRDVVIIKDKRDFEAYSAFIRVHPVFVKKKVDESRGRSVELVDTAEEGFSAAEHFQSLLTEGKVILEERIVQSTKMAALYPGSVNTIRVMTFHINGEVRIGPCFLKVGQGGSFVDNGGAGGILIGIDNQIGVLNTAGFDEFMNTYQEHPDTGTCFEGYSLPEWEQVVCLSKELAVMDSKVHYIAWDFAYTDVGWVVVEANGGGQFVGPQITRQAGIKEEIRDLGGEFLRDW